jgi:AcrR family transcriptional regulator
VSRRALYVHFETIEELIATAIERRPSRCAPSGSHHSLDAPLVRRVDGFCRRWSQLSRGPGAAAAGHAVHEPFSPQVGSVREHTRQWARAVVEQAFEPELDPLPEREREGLTRALHHATSWSAWDELRVQGADVEASC